MKKLYKPLTKFNFILTGLLLFMYASIRFSVVFLREYPKGDESSFLEVFKIFINKGYYSANVLGNSSTFNGISYLFYKITSNELMSLRLTSLTFGILSLAVLWIFYKKYFEVPNIYRFTAFITAVNTMIIMSWIFVGIDDVILSFLTVLFFMCIYKLKKQTIRTNYLYIAIGIIIALMLLTREMSVLFFPSIIIVLGALFYINNESTKAILTNSILMISAFIVILFTFNFPSLAENRKLSFHQKLINSTEVNWTQLQYLAALGEEQGKLPHGKHFSVDEVAKYLKDNGQESLPKTLTESIFFDFSRTIREFFKDTLYEIKPFSRLLGLFFIFNLMLFILYLFKREFILNKILNQHLFLFSIIYILLVCFIVITYVETRWFSNVLLLLPIVFAERIYKFKTEYKLGDNFDFIMINLQLLSLTIMSLPYLINNIGVLF